MAQKSIAIIGAGPIGLEAALYGVRLGHDVQVFERGRVGDNVRSWGFVRLFSSAALNRSSLGLAALREAGVRLPHDDSYQSGAEHVAAYLEPLAGLPALRGRIHENHRIVQVAREHLGKGLPLGEERSAHPFRVLIESPEGEHLVRADVVLDCSGTYGNANWLGSGNAPALGERSAASKIAYTLQDVTGADRERYAGRRVLVVGSGHSAATALDGLAGLPGTRVIWVTRGEASIPCPLIAGDPLPERDSLSRRVNALVADTDRAVQFMPGFCVDALSQKQHGIDVRLRDRSGRVAHLDGDRAVDTILAHVGYHPDTSLYRELQVHTCYATEGPMKLAATLLGTSSADCLAQESAGPDALANPEPDFYILGAKSYGRNSQFLIQLGLSQVREVFTRIERRPELDLYAA